MLMESAAKPSFVAAGKEGDVDGSGHPLRSSLQRKLADVGPLIPLGAVDKARFRGPTPWSNWLIPGRVLAGTYPGAVDDETQIENIEALLGVGVSCVVCLQNEMDHKTPRSKWAKGSRAALRPYADDMRFIARAQRAERGEPEFDAKYDPVQLIQVNMVEGDTVGDGVMDKVMRTLLRQLEQGRVLYVHGWLGHGRVGTVCAILLNRLYALDSGAAINYAQAVHDCRECLEGTPRVKVPSTTKQRTQVTRMCNAANAPGPSGAAGRGAAPPPKRALPRASAATTSVVSRHAGVGAATGGSPRRASGKASPYASPYAAKPKASPRAKVHSGGRS